MTVPVSARREASNYLHSTGPDVCLTPMGSGMVPVAYSCICILENSSRTSRTVNNNTVPDFQLNTRCTRTQGHEPGTGRGVVVPGYLSVSHIRQAEGTIYSEGWAIVRDGHPAWMNRPDEGAVETRRSKSTNTVEHF
ncbi:PAAR-like domain-containing protein [Xanthobacteraceae bacterium A53D]